MLGTLSADTDPELWQDSLSVTSLVTRWSHWVPQLQSVLRIVTGFLFIWP